MSLHGDPARDIFPERLSALMEARGVTADDLAAGRMWMQGWTAELVQSWLDGTAFPCPRKFAALLVAFGVERDELLT